MTTEKTTPNFKRSLDYQHQHQDENRPLERSIGITGSSTSYSKDDFSSYKQYNHHQHHHHQIISTSTSIDAAESSSCSSIFNQDYSKQQQQQKHSGVTGSRVLREMNINNQQNFTTTTFTPSSLSTRHQFISKTCNENSSSSITKPKLVYCNSTTDSPAIQTDSSEKVPSQATDFKPLSSERLRPIRQKTRNAVVSILEDETVALEFLQKRNGDDYVIEVLLISGDGIKVTQFHPNGRQGIELADTPPTLQSSTAVSYAFSALPTKLWKKYQYAEKFVRLVKMKTPKVFLNSEEIKSKLA